MNQPSLPNAHPTPIFQPVTEQWQHNHWTWSGAIAFALASHLMIAVWFMPSDNPRAGALDLGSEGIDVGLGLAGSYMAAASNPKPLAEPTPPDTPRPDPADPAPKPQTPSPTKPVNEPTVVRKTVTQPPVAPKAVVESPNARPPIEPAVTADNSAAATTLTQTSPDNKASQIDSAALPAPAPNTGTASADDPTQSRAQQKATGRAKDQQTGGKRGDAKHYYSKLMAWLNRHKTYPKQAKKAKQQGVATVRFTIARNGSILFKKLEKSSGVAQLDKAALQLLEDANPVPKLPKKLQKEQLTVVIPIEYSLITQ